MQVANPCTTLMYTHRIAGISAPGERDTATPFPWRPDELRRTATDLMARFPDAHSEDVARALTRAAEGLAPHSGAASLLLRASREMSKNFPAAPATGPIDFPLNSGAT
jgi:hypothetical protein